MDTKPNFKYRLPNSTEVVEIDSTIATGVGRISFNADPQIEELHQQYLTSIEPMEIRWKNLMLRNTDYLLLADATVNGEIIKGTYREAEIIEFRRRVRNSSPRTEPRPEPPKWFNTAEFIGG